MVKVCIQMEKKFCKWVKICQNTVNYSYFKAFVLLIIYLSIHLYLFIFGTWSVSLCHEMNWKPSHRPDKHMFALLCALADGDKMQMDVESICHTQSTETISHQSGCTYDASYWNDRLIVCCIYHTDTASLHCVSS